jgi:hypothetical protein
MMLSPLGQEIWGSSRNDSKGMVPLYFMAAENIKF